MLLCRQHVNTSDPLAPPSIDPRYLSNDIGVSARTFTRPKLICAQRDGSDKQLALQIAKLPRKIARTKPLTALVISYTSDNITSEADWTE